MASSVNIELVSSSARVTSVESAKPIVLTDTGTQRSDVHMDPKKVIFIFDRARVNDREVRECFAMPCIAELQVAGSNSSLVRNGHWAEWE